jgi:predicted RNA-binding protein with PUA-like domain
VQVESKRNKANKQNKKKDVPEVDIIAQLLEKAKIKYEQEEQEGGLVVTSRRFSLIPAEKDAALEQDMKALAISGQHAVFFPHD